MTEYGFQELEALDILFRRTQPEIIMEKYRVMGGAQDLYLYEMEDAPYSYDLFEHYGRLGLWDFTYDENRQIYQFLMEKLDILYEERKAVRENTYPGRNIYDLLWDYGNTVLIQRIGDPQPLLKIEKILDWRTISYKLGQDLIICAWLAHAHPKLKRPILNWQPCLFTNDTDLNALLKTGIAENHFHLHGSTQSFALNWACMMNHPVLIEKVFKSTSLFRDNLEVNILRNPRDYMEPWPARLCRAAMLRGLLFGRLVGLMDEESFEEEFWLFDADPLAGRAQGLAEKLTSLYGRAFSLLGGGYSCLDYAISETLCKVRDSWMVRLLIGERAFLFHCFRWQEAGRFTPLEGLAFYQYILIRNAFRSEMIQVNQRPGFRNFAYYQDRKSFFIDNHNDYFAETMRLSVGRGLRDEKIKSLEARITPKSQETKMRNSYREMDRYLEHALRNMKFPYDFLNENTLKKIENEYNRSFYVIHFPKIPEKKRDIDRCEIEHLPRNGMLRRKNETQALALRDCLAKPDDRRRIRGIDACTYEIGCRPEIYGTEMRFLRIADRQRKGAEWQVCRQEECFRKKLGLTYHVGEDYMDVADGLRAVDEAVHFLHMTAGDRIGHGLVLGVTPEIYYKKKHMTIHHHAQDRLDDLVWILNRGEIFLQKYDINDGLITLRKNRDSLTREAEDLYKKIYDAASTSGWMNLYYRAWKLRGDHPDLYRKGIYNPDSALRADPLFASCMINPGMGDFRINKNVKDWESIAALYYRYHFDYTVRRKGFMDHRFKVETWYCKLMEYLQEAMRNYIMEKGILIEANPSSNLVIGSLDQYENHPVFKFHPVEAEASHLDVSINTDDIGVFDTTLSNEYALILQAARELTAGGTKQNDAAIFKWLDELRQTGMSMSFL